MTQLAPFLLLAAMPAQAAASAVGPMPAAYRGDWAIGAERCAPGSADNNIIRITARRIQESALRMDVRTVTPTGNGAIIASGRITNGDARYDSGMRLELVDGGKALAVGEGEDFGRYVRCKR